MRAECQTQPLLKIKLYKLTIKQVIFKTHHSIIILLNLTIIYMVEVNSIYLHSGTFGPTQCYVMVSYCASVPNLTMDDVLLMV